MSNIHGLNDLPRYQPQRNPAQSGGGGGGGGGYSSNYSQNAYSNFSGYAMQTQMAMDVSPEGGISMMVPPPRADGQIPTCGERFFPRASWYTATAVLSIIDVIIFITTLIVGQAKFDGAFVSSNSMGGPSAQTLLYMGGKWSPDIESGAVWRLLTPIFLHAGIIHILSNLFFQCRFCFVLEARWTIWRFLVIYFITGINASLWSAVLSPGNVSVGASGALFGVVGADATYLAYNWKAIPHANQEALMLAIMSVITFLVGIGTEVDNFAHLGGLISGFFYGVVVPPTITLRETEIFYRIGAAVGAAGLFLLFCLLLFVGKPQP